MSGLPESGHDRRIHPFVLHSKAHQEHTTK